MRVSFVATLVLSLLLTACLPGAADVPPPLPLSPTPEPELVTITWGFWGDPWEVEINNRVIEVFEADHPHIRIKTFHRPWNTYLTELRSKFEAKEPVPDVLFWSEAASDVSKGYFMDLTPMMKAENYKLDDFFPGLLIHFKVGDGIYGLPRDSDTKVIFYNKRLFNQANLSYPKDGWTWDDLRNNALALKEAKVVDYSFAYEPNDWWMIWMWQNGVQLFDNKLAPTQSYFDQPAAAAAVQFLADLTNVDQVTPPYESLNSAGIASLFTNGKLAMAFGNHALIPAFAEVKDLEWDVVGLPQQQRRANLASGAGYLIAAKTAQPDAAWTFLKFLSGPKGQAIFAEAGVAVPARRSVAQSDVFLQQLPPHNALVFLEETEIGESIFAFPGSHRILNLVNEALIPVWHGQQDAASTLKAISPQIEAIVAESQLGNQHAQ